MSIKEYLELNNLTVRDLAESAGIHFTTAYRLSLPRANKQSRNKISLDIAQKIVNGTKGQVTLIDLLEKK